MDFAELTRLIKFNIEKPKGNCHLHRVARGYGHDPKSN
jgi:hypothetical protein